MRIIETEKVISPDGAVQYYDRTDPTLSFAIKEDGNGQRIVKVGTFENVMNWVKSLGNKAVRIRIQPDPPSEESM